VFEPRGELAVLGPALAEIPSEPAPALLAELKRAVATIRARLDRLELAFDLAEEIGSARWLWGAARLIGLCALAVVLTPEITALRAGTAMPLDALARDEFRSQMIAPLALGGDSGRRMPAGSAVVPLTAAPIERPILQLTATLGQGDTIGAMLLRAGVTPYDAARTAELIGSVTARNPIDPGTMADLTLGQRDPATGQRPLERLTMRARFDLQLAVQRSNGALGISAQPITVDTTPLRIRGIVGTGIYRSARAAGAPIEAIQQYLQTIDQHLSLDTDIAPTDTFDIIIAYRRSAAGEVQVGDLLYAGIDRDEKPRAQLLRWGKEGQFFEASGMGAQRSGLIMPVIGGRVTSNFGARRHPILGYTRMHAGVDFAAAYGSPIFAVGDATVVQSGWAGGHGNHVKLDHGGGFATGYSHMSRIAVSAGSHVRAGQVIGYVGSTGLSTGPHLHYELFRNGEKVNPLTVRFTVSTQVDAKELAAFRARLATLKAVRAGAPVTTLAPHAVSAASSGVREIDKAG
jgi:murein DD-endopeptidase MepM/ murein hydrolase activator NlpD